jgi:hypothetical protein
VFAETNTEKLECLARFDRLRARLSSWAASCYVVAANAATAEEPRHSPAGALTNLATGTASIAAPSSDVLTYGPGYHHVPATVPEGEFKIPAAPERGMLGHHDEQVMPSSSWNTLPFVPFKA